MTAALQHTRHGFEAMHEAALDKSSELSGRMFSQGRVSEHHRQPWSAARSAGHGVGHDRGVWQPGAGGGQAGAGDLAGGISKALVNTLLGLALAIVAIGFFGVCRNRIESLTVAGRSMPWICWSISARHRRGDLGQQTPLRLRPPSRHHHRGPRQTCPQRVSV